MTAFPYLSHAGFLGAAKATPEHRFAVAGVCWDGSVTNRPGARFGPRAIRARATAVRGNAASTERGGRNNGGFRCELLSRHR